MSFRPTASLENLRQRACLLRRIRTFFDSRAFFEVQTPVLSNDTVIDSYVEPIPVPWTLSGAPHTFYLQTSPEFAMKRLVASGMDAIYQLTPAFRSGDRGTQHNIEFTMLEWYRTGDTYEQGRHFLAELICELLGLEQCEERPFAQPFWEATGLDVHLAHCDEFQQFADQAGLIYPESFLAPESPATRDDWIDFLFSALVQPTLAPRSVDGKLNAVILYDYPGTQSQLAQARFEPVSQPTFGHGPAESPTDRPAESPNGTFAPAENVSSFTSSCFTSSREKMICIAERFELFVNGIELANGYNELRDASILRQRNAQTLQVRSQNHLPPLPDQPRLLEAMEAGFPICCGCALGVDRLLMLLLDAQTIDDVIAFPIEIA